jgi:tRNA 2-thiouridine synthesizing protein E
MVPPSIQPTVRIAPLVVEDRMLPTDLLGYLLDPMQWDEQVAAVLAEREGIVLGVQHWTLIWFVRDYFEQNQALPEARVLLKAMRTALGEQFATRRYLHQLFPYGYGPQLCKIAGMTMPRKLMLDL